MKRRTVVSMEQALSLSYATLRFVQLGWRVIRLEATPRPGILPGDPNRYIGSRIADDDRRSYFVTPNVGKEAIALDLKDPVGQRTLRRILEALEVDVFCCNTLPSRYAALGIDDATLRRARPDLIWAAISAMGPEFPDVPGYDPALQAMVGYMELTGPADGPPMLSGVPIIDLKAGDEVYANVLLALAERAETGAGRAIHVSMFQAAASWLITTLPLLDFDCHPSEVSRCGNEHRKFIPVNAYPTRDGYVFIAIGNDLQWQRLVEIPTFAPLADEARRTNEGRLEDRQAIHREMAARTAGRPTDELARDLAAARIPHAPIQTIRQVRDHPAIDRTVTRTTTPDGRTVHLPPLAVDLEGAPREYSFAPRYGQDTEAVLIEAGLDADRIEHLRRTGVIVGP